jgi:DnaK suppressor protein
MGASNSDAGPTTEEARADAEARLVALHAEYMARAGKIAADRGERLPQDSEERAVTLENADVLDALQREAIEEAAKVKAALERLRAGNYGTCTVCGEPIGASRLEAYPAAVRCIDCKQAAESSGQM